MKFRALLFALALAVPSAVAQTIPDGTVLPVMLSSTLDARHSKLGQKITGKLMQDVSLPDGQELPHGSRVTGHIVTGDPPESGSGSIVAVKFQSITIKGREVPITTHLRALASMFEVFQATLPVNDFADRGTSSSDWDTTQIGGAQVNRAAGQVIADGGDIVGKSTDYGAVRGKLIARRDDGCHASTREESLWLFSPWACGVYGFTDLQIAHRGRSDPVGEIALLSNGDIHVRGGSGWLLRVSTSPSSPHTVAQ